MGRPKGSTNKVKEEGGAPSIAHSEPPECAAPTLEGNVHFAELLVGPASIRKVRTEAIRASLTFPRHATVNDIRSMTQHVGLDDGLEPVEWDVKQLHGSQMVVATDVNGWYKASVTIDGAWTITKFWPTNLQNRLPSQVSPQDQTMSGTDLDAFIEMLQDLRLCADEAIEDLVANYQSSHEAESAKIGIESELAVHPLPPDPEDVLMLAHRDALGGLGDSLTFLSRAYGVPFNVLDDNGKPTLVERSIMEVKADVLNKLKTEPLVAL